MSFNFKQYVRGLLTEQVRTSGANLSTVDASNYKENPPGSGIFDSKTGKDPYSYSIVSTDSQRAVIKVVSAPSYRQSAVGRNFSITINNLDNPNVQLLYSSLLNLGKINRLQGDENSFKIGSFTADIIIAERGFGYENYFKEQHDKIKQLGHENANSTLVDQLNEFSLGVVNPTGNTLSEKINNMIQTIESATTSQVVSLVIFPGSVRYMAKENSLKYVKDVFETGSDFTNMVKDHITKVIDSGGQPPPGETLNIIVDDSVKDISNAPVGRESITQTLQKKCLLGYDASDYEKPPAPGQKYRTIEQREFCPVANSDNVYEDSGGDRYRIERYTDSKIPIFRYINN